MPLNEAETRYEPIDPVLRDQKGYKRPYIKLETKAPVEHVGFEGKRRSGPGRTDYLLCVDVPGGKAPLPVGILGAKKEDADPLKRMQQATRTPEEVIQSIENQRKIVVDALNVLMGILAV